MFAMNSVAAYAYFMRHRGIFERITLLCTLLCSSFAPCARHLACRWRNNAFQQGLRRTRHWQRERTYLL